MSRPSRKPTRQQANPDREFDFHGYTAARMREELELRWGRGEWHGLRNVRIVHGKGAVLGRELQRWAREKGAAFTLEEHGGATLLHPGRRAQTAPFPPHRPLNGLGRALAAAGGEQQNERVNEWTSEGVNEGARPVVRSSTQSPADPATQRPNGPSDLMAAEYARLGEDGAVETYRRKQGLLGPAEPVPETTAGPTSASTAERSPPPAIHKPQSAIRNGDDDLFAAELERLGAEDPRVTRSRKGREG